MILAIFDVQVTPIIPIKFQVTDLSDQKKFKIDFQDDDCGGRIGFPIRINLAIFDLQVTQILPTKFREKWAFQFRRKIDFQDSGHGSHLGLLIGMILAIFDLQVTLMLSTKYRVNWPFGSGQAGQIRFPR